MATLKRSECWMTFTEVLEQYLDNRERFSPPGSFSDDRRLEDLAEAVAHLEALTTPETN